MEAQNILLNARKEMIELGHPYIGTEHLLLSILKSDSNIANRLNSYNLTYDKFKEELCRVVGTTNKKSEYFLYTPLFRKIIENAIIDSRENNDGEVTIEHLFFAMLEEGEGIAIRILIGMDIDIEKMYDDFSSSLIEKAKKSKKKKLTIYDLGFDMTSDAKKGLFDPVIGREKEVKRVMEILCRRTKNNPILIGEAGTGKTAIVEELARMIANDEVPSNLIGKKIISLDMATMVAGTKYRGEFEERMKKVVRELEENDDIILFIDEIHTLVGAGGAEGAIDASNILKPALARGKIRCIGATTILEYKKFIEKDTALERRFQKVNVFEPSIEETKNIINNLKPIYEKYHNVIVSSEIVDSIISLSEKYIFDRNRPDKEIDILDEVCSMVGMRDNKNILQIKKIRKEIKRLGEEKNNYIIDNNIDKAYDIRKKETELLSTLNKLEINSHCDKNKITIKDVAFAINNRTNIPIYEVMENSGDYIDDFKNNLSKKIVGEEKAINDLVNISKRIKTGYNDRIYSFLFVGPSGVGKSELSKLYANYLVGENNFIRFDMSEYSDSTSVNKILGSSPGYVGYDDDRNILEEVRDKPNSVILLDEIDKAHPSVINLFYQILENGKIKNSKGIDVRFNNSIIIMTSNVGYETNGIGFNKSGDSSVLSTLKNYFSASFINRIDSVIMFNKLDKETIRDIVKCKLEEINNRYKDININYSDNLVDEIVNMCKYEEFGARRISKIIQSKVECKIIDAIINKEKIIYINNIKENITS